MIIIVIRRSYTVVIVGSVITVCRYTSESSVSLNRSPGNPSSFRSDDEFMTVLDGLREADVDR